MLILFQNVLTFTASDGQNACDWMLQSRVWFPLQTCKITQSISLSQTQTSNGSVYVNNNISVVNVFNISPYMPYWCQYSLLQVDQNATLSNALFYINATIDLVNASSYCSGENITISVFDQINGILDNVSVTGVINVVNFNSENTSLFVSQFFGNVGPGFNSTSFNNLRSNLQYTINGLPLSKLTVKTPNCATCTYARTNAQIQIYSNIFNTINVQNATNTVYFTNQAFNNFNSSNFTNQNMDFIQKTNLIIQNYNNTKLMSYTEQIQDGLYGSIQNYVIHTAFENSGNMSNIYITLYQTSVTNFLEKLNATENLYIKYYYENNSEDIYFDSDNNYTQTVYFSNFVAIGFPKNGPSHYCDANQLYDIQTQQCTTQAQCISNNRFIYQTLCLHECPENYSQFNSVCYMSCPSYIGLVPNANDNSTVPSCINCTAQAFPNSTSSACSANTSTTGISQCSNGMILNSSQMCVYPVSEADCTSNNFQFFVSLVNYENSSFITGPTYCTNSQEIGLYLLYGTNTLSNMCNGNVSFSQVCNQNMQVACQNNGVLISSNISHVKLCQIGCAFQQVFDGTQCTNESCSDLMYSFEEYAICLHCNSSYDGGSFFNRLSAACQTDCVQSINETATSMVCENISSTYCPHTVEFLSGGQQKGLCIKANCNSTQFWNRSLQQCQNTCSYQNGSICETLGDQAHCPYAYSNGPLTGRQCTFLKCPLYHTMINQTVVCLSSCNLSQFVESDNSCQSSCQSQFFINSSQNVCVPECPSSLSFVNIISNQSQCISQCPLSATYVNFTTMACLTSCNQPVYFSAINNLSFCLSQCPLGYVPDDKKACSSVAAQNQASNNLYYGVAAAAGVAIVATIIIISVACCRKQKIEPRPKMYKQDQQKVNYYAKQLQDSLNSKVYSDKSKVHKLVTNQKQNENTTSNSVIQSQIPGPKTIHENNKDNEDIIEQNVIIEDDKNKEKVQIEEKKAEVKPIAAKKFVFNPQAATRSSMISSQAGKQQTDLRNPTAMPAPAKTGRFVMPQQKGGLVIQNNKVMGQESGMPRGK